jgi:uncharacterized protein (DUF608 family)
MKSTKIIPVIFLCTFLFFSLFSLSAADTYYDLYSTQSTPHVYEGNYLTGIDFPIGAMGGGTIRMNGKAERAWWQIFNNFEERAGSGVVPNSFFAIRTNTNGNTLVRALQTSAVGSFPAMSSLKFTGEYPFGWYNFDDNTLPVEVRMEAFNPLIPMDLKNSAIPCAIFKITVKNTSTSTSSISLMGTQQNAVGFDGYGTISNSRQFNGYGNNVNTIVSDALSTSLKMTGTNGSLQLSAYETGMTSTASWNTVTTLYDDFAADGALIGTSTASSPGSGTTVDGALAKSFTLAPGEEKTVTFVLSWYFPGGTFGRADIAGWHFPSGGCMYENWWANASEVADYVKTNFTMLDAKTRLYHETLYTSNIPRYAIDRISSNLCVIKTPTFFWLKNGYVGFWESTSSKQDWYGNCKHVYQTTQSISWIFPELARKIMDQNNNSQLSTGGFPARDGSTSFAMDGHLGTILGMYREYLLNDGNTWLTSVWPKTKKAMDYVITTFDGDKNGTFLGAYANTLDGSTSGSNPIVCGMYVASLKACARMAERMNDMASRDLYISIAVTAKKNLSTVLWDDDLKFFVERSQNLANTRNYGDGSYIGMLDGQWWSGILDLGQVFDVDKSLSSLQKIYTRNKVTDINGSNNSNTRDFLGNGDSGWKMSAFTTSLPTNPIHYLMEIMSGFEYTFAGAMLQYGMINEGLDVVNNIAKRYDGRLRNSSEVTAAANSTVFGTGSPFGEDECGDFYGRPMSSWSILLALQGFSYDGTIQRLKFNPVWKPENHVSFYSSSTGFGLLRQTQTATNQVSKMEVKSGNTKVKTIVLAVPANKLAQNIVVKLDGAVLPTSSIKQSGNTLTINLTNTSDVNANSDIAVSFDLATGTSVKEYTTLSNLKVDGTNLSDFSPEKKSYTIVLPNTSTKAPVVTAELSDGNAYLAISQPTSIPGTANLVVTSLENDSVTSYVVNFELETTLPVSFESFLDTFNDGGMAGWTIKNGTWTNPGTALQGDIASGDIQIHKNGILGSNFIYEADIKMTSTRGAGVLSFRETDSTSYFVALDKSSSLIKLYKTPYNSLMTASYTFTTDVWYHLKIVANYTNIKVYFNNATAPIIDYNDSTYTKGKFGLFTWSGTALFDNVQATPLPSSLILDGLSNKLTPADTIFTATTSSTTSIFVYDPASWPVGVPVPVLGNTDKWSTGIYTLYSSGTRTFNGGTLRIPKPGFLTATGGGTLSLNNLTLDGGTISIGAGGNFVLNLQGNTFTLNSGFIRTLSNAVHTIYTRSIVFQNALLAGSGTITITTYQPSAVVYEDYIEFQSSINTTGFTGTFEVIPGMFNSPNSSAGGHLKLNAISSPTFSVSVPAINTTTGVISNGISYKGVYNGKLFFTPGAGNTVKLKSLSLGGINIAPGTYSYADFANYSGTNLQAYLNSASTGTITVAGLNSGINQPVQNNLVFVKEKGFQLNNSTISLQVFNLVGICLINKQNVSESSFISLPKTGMYLVKVKAENGISSVQKIMIK